MAGGIVGAVVSQIAGQVISQTLGSLISQFGMGNLAGALTNSFMGGFADALKGIIDNAPLPQFIKDAAKQAIDDVLWQNQQETTSECQRAVDDSEAGQTARCEGESAAADVAAACCKGDDEEGLSWLAAMAKALGRKAGEHFEKAHTLSNEITDMDATAKGAAIEMNAKTAQMQAEAQLGSMVMNATSTVIKAIGESMSAIARKQ